MRYTALSRYPAWAEDALECLFQTRIANELGAITGANYLGRPNELLVTMYAPLGKVDREDWKEMAAEAEDTMHHDLRWLHDVEIRAYEFEGDFQATFVVTYFGEI